MRASNRSRLFSRARAILFSAALGFAPASAFAQTDAVPEGHCFDFTRPETASTQVAAQLPPEMIDSRPLSSGDSSVRTATGEFSKGGVWAALRTVVVRPVSEVLRLLKNPGTLKDLSQFKVESRSVPRPGFTDFLEVDLEFVPIPFVRLKWGEQWATWGDSLVTQIRYQKTRGSGLIKRFCGQITVRAVGSKTDLSLYEEVDAPRRSALGVLEGHRGTVRTLLTEKLAPNR